MSAVGSVGSPPQEHPSPSAGIVISSSPTSPSEGTSSDSCLTSAGDSPGGLSGRLAAQGLVGTCSPLRLASPLLGAQSATPVLQAQGALGGAALLPVSFQEGRRASDTSLTQGDFPFRSHFHLPQALEGITLSLMAGVPPSSRRVWVEQQCSVGRLQCCPRSGQPGLGDSHRPLVARDTRIPGSSSCLQELWGQGGIPHLAAWASPPNPGLGGGVSPPPWSCGTDCTLLP